MHFDEALVGAGGNDRGFVFDQVAQVPILAGGGALLAAFEGRAVGLAVALFDFPGGGADGARVGGVVFAHAQTRTDRQVGDGIFEKTLAQAGGGGPASLGPVGPAVADIFAAGIYSLQETRLVTMATPGGDALGHQRGTLQVDWNAGMPGVLYHCVLLWEGRTAAGDGTGDTSAYGSSWSNYTTTSFDVRAASDGTFSSGTVDLPYAAGMQIRLKSVLATPING